MCDQNPSLTYSSLHRRVQEARGKASAQNCVDCGEQARDWANLTGNYADPSDYQPMCRRCHLEMDGVLQALRTGPKAKGTKNGRAKLTELDVKAIRLGYEWGQTQTRLAAMFGVSQHTVSCVVRRKAWAHVQ